MQPVIREVAIGDRSDRGTANCEYCGSRMTRAFPYNFPQVCHDCADVHVWHYCDRKPERSVGSQPVKEVK